MDALAASDIISIYTEINDVLIQTDFSIYPNPANESLVINAEFGLETIEIYNLLGKKVVGIRNDAKGMREMTFDVSEFDAGIYFVKLMDGERQSVQKLIIQ